MTRVAVRLEDGTTGWYDDTKLQGTWSESTDLDANQANIVGRGSGRQLSSHASAAQWLHLTAGGRWVLETDLTGWYGGGHTHDFTTPDEARDWLIRMDEHDAVAQHFPDTDDERGPGGRPAIGEPVNIRLGDLQTAVDAYAQQHTLTRAAAVRTLLLLGLEHAGATEDGSPTSVDPDLLYEQIKAQLDDLDAEISRGPLVGETTVGRELIYEDYRITYPDGGFLSWEVNPLDGGWTLAWWPPEEDGAVIDGQPHATTLVADVVTAARRYAPQPQ